MGRGVIKKEEETEEEKEQEVEKQEERTRKKRKLHSAPVIWQDSPRVIGRTKYT
jgi:hypothetical protein